MASMALNSSAVNGIDCVEMMNALASVPLSGALCAWRAFWPRTILDELYLGPV